jgi:hypothetical protein
MKKILGLLVLAVVFASCGESTTNEKVADETKAAVEEVKMVTLTPDNFTDKAKGLIEKEVLITGTVDHTCKHGGKKMVIFGEDADKTVKIYAAGEIDKFDIELEGGVVAVKGIVKEMRIDEEYMADWEAETKEHHGDNADELAEELEKIANFREKIAATEEGYISNFSIDCISYEVIKKGTGVANEDHEESEEEGHDH